ncbi:MULTISPECIES: hypothetical protein [Brevibacillus]|jgi:hypothetical protein|uniref:Uncharacterized protein n=1 Tax=Brevibacillus borstelensis AK1 TaxID=1300222 RepID=M8DJ91_9BACL|nr:hypothetical protein [Brevibacillus borstelensis]EMT53643.1 hypothetical protein I532_06505 [Brevibacillus borstelensis AK1]KKX52980.1 hypothetical protein X546_20685 [Brevibacillus borstelensis cifa_chp40]MBE5397747.1 hypothetical protein [Brevibacillus borstelensis]MCC0562684.1 hypothetical protein [Brevibacillus borstelensis]MCM3469707.1 hypothetical protein [Brevibacillus borstelensis]
MVAYTFDQSLIEIQETENENDVTFSIEVKSEDMRNRLKQVRSYFEDNKDYTDAFFYSRQGGSYEVIVRKDAVIPFLVQAFRFRCLESLQWK